MIIFTLGNINIVSEINLSIIQLKLFYQLKCNMISTLTANMSKLIILDIDKYFERNWHFT